MANTNVHTHTEESIVTSKIANEFFEMKLALVYLCSCTLDSDDDSPDIVKVAQCI